MMYKNFYTKVAVSFILMFFINQYLKAQQNENNLSKEIVFIGDHIVYQGRTIHLGPKAFYINGQFSDEEASKYKFVYNSVNEAVKHLTNGTEEAPMILYIAPYVYWIDDPDDPAIRIPKTGASTPFGLEVECEWLKFYGLSSDARNVVLASNRGQTIGAKGNFTMLNIMGQGLSAENLTFGNYCNIDLEYPLKPELNRKKRGSAIVQAQLVFCNGDKVIARNTRFVSRLNLSPFWGSKRTLLEGCHFESTDDALNGAAVYLNCSFNFYSSKPFGHTIGTGAVLLNCNIRSFTHGEQYFVKGPGPVTTIDTRVAGENISYLGWRDIPDSEARYYQFSISLNNQIAFLSKDKPSVTVDMTGKEVLNAYRFEFKNRIVYNTFNLLRGNDNWDPMGIKEIVLEVEKETGKNYSAIPTQLLINPTRKKLETGKDSLLLTATVNRFGNYEIKGENISWATAPEYHSLIKLQDNKDGTCKVIPTNNNDETKEVTITASNALGLEAATILYIAPSFLSPPAFIELPKITKSKNGELVLNYKLDLQYKDESLVSWYRSSDAKGSNPIEIEVSRFNRPLKTYKLSSGDIGYFIMNSICPKHLRCNAGKAEITIFSNAISAKDVKENQHILIPNLENMSTKYQPEIRPGFWTIDSYAPADTHEQNWEADNSRDPWYYGPGVNGAANDSGLVQATKGARMRYTPIGNSFGDIKISFTAIPAKTAGQGFSSARDQYMDIGIKMDNINMNGYALRLIRTTKYSDAIDFVIMKYVNGKAEAVSAPVSASCYRPNCTIEIEVKGNKLTVHAENAFNYSSEIINNEVVKVVDIEAEIMPNQLGGISFQHTGTVDSGATLIKDLVIEWK